MRKYEMTYLISDEVPESDLNKITGKISGLINELGGKITKEDIWGRRKLAYPIKKQEFATYVTVYFNLAGSKLFEFDKEVRLLAGVLRHLTLVKDLGNEGLVLTTDDIAEAGEIKDVLGGEKSFEAVEGQTEESLDLMAKREKEEEKVEEAAPEINKEAALEVAEEVTEEKTEEKAEKKAKKEAAPAEEEEKVEEVAPEINEEAALEVAEEVTEEKTEEKEAKKPKAKKAEKTEKEEKVQEEVDRLSKLNDELDDILKDEL